MSLDYHLSYQVAHCFQQLLEDLQHLCTYIRQESPPLWMLHAQELTYSQAQDYLIQALQDIWYLTGQDGRYTRTYIGIVAVSAPLMQAAVQVNHSKLALKQALDAIKKAYPQAWSSIKANLHQQVAASLKHQRPFALQGALASQGLSALHLKQSWRQLPLLDTPVEQVRFSWYSSGRSIKRLSVAQAHALLMAMNPEDPLVARQLKALAQLPSTTPLAQVQAQAPLMRANVFYQQALDDGRTRRALNVALPLFIQMTHLPEHNQPSLNAPEARTRKQRADNQLADEVFLPSLRAYLYKDAYR